MCFLWQGGVMSKDAAVELFVINFFVLSNTKYLFSQVPRPLVALTSNILLYFLGILYNIWSDFAIVKSGSVVILIIRGSLALELVEPKWLTTIMFF